MYLLHLFCQVMDRVDNLDLLLVWCYPQIPDFHFPKLKVGCWKNSLNLYLCSAHKHQSAHSLYLGCKPFKVIYRPSRSTILWLMVQSIPFLHKIATPRELELPWQDIISAPHLFLHWFSVAAIEYVSCKKKTRSALHLRHQRKMVLLLRKLLKSFTLRH